MRVLNDEEIMAIFLTHFAKQYGEEAAKELQEQLPDCNYAKTVAKAQHRQDLKDFIEWLETFEFYDDFGGECGKAFRDMLVAILVEE